MFFRKKKLMKSCLKSNAVVHKFDRIMFLSCVRLSPNRYELTFMYDYIYNFNENRTFIPLKLIISYNDYSRIINLKFGVWLKVTCFFLQSEYVYIYQNKKNNRLIYKATKHDNYINHGNINQYNHELLFKGSVRDNCIFEYLGG